MKALRNTAYATILASLPLTAIMTSHHTQQCGIVFDESRHQFLSNLTPASEQRLRNKARLTSSELCEIPVDRLQKTVWKMDNPKPDHPGQAMAFRHMQQLSDNQQFNAENWLKSREQVRNMLQNARRGAGLNPTLWEPLGPGNIGGRIRSFAFDPDNSTRIYAGSVSGGVWLSEDSGVSWNPTDDFMANLSVSTLIFDPTDSNTIYAGTGEGTFNVDNVRGLGVFKSSDKGVTWEGLANTQNTFDFYWVNRLTMLNDSSRILAATHTGIWISDDGGINWSQTYSGRSNDINVHPADNTKLIAGTWTGAIYSSDGGDTWNSATGLTGLSSTRVEIAYSTSAPDTTYASVDQNDGEVWQSTDGGQSYSLINSSVPYLNGQGWYDNALWVDPVNSDHIIVGGLDLYRSTDGGTNLTKISTWQLSPSSAHADHHFVLEHPDYDGVTNKQVYFANDGGMYRADDIEVASGSTGWQELNNQLSITQFYGIGVAPDGTVIGGTQDNGTLVYKGDSEGWTETFGGDGGFSAADPTDSNYLYGEYVYLQLHRSTNGGNGSSWIDEAKINVGANFIAPFILDPNNPNRLLGGAAELWVSDDVKSNDPTWDSLKGTTPSSSPISAIAVALGNSDIIYVGHNDGSLYKTIDGTSASPTWDQIDTPSMPQRYLMRIAIDPLNTDTVFISYGGYNDENLWKSTDGGTNWNLSVGTAPNTIPSAPIRTIAIHQTRTDQIYIGTEVGIFSSEDGGATWDIENDGPANVSVDELVWGGPETLYAATHGRGIFSANVRDDAPSNLFFPPANDTPLSSVQETEPQTISGLGVEVDVTVAGADSEYSLGCTGTYTTTPGRANNGDTICLRHTSSADYFTTVTTEITIGVSTFNFESRTIADTTPDSFSFDTISDADLNSQQESNAITVSGITNQVDVQISDGEYSIGCTGNNFTASNGTILLGETICVRHTTSSEHLVNTTTTLTLGDVSANFETTTLPDTTPDDFSFAPLNDIDVSSVQTSSAATISGFQVPIPISVTNGEYSIGCDNTFTANAGQISPDQSVCVRHTASADYVAQTATTLTINGVTADFVSTTSPDRDPDTFSFASISNVELSSAQTSATVTISGIAVDVNISVSGGEYSVGCSATFTSAAATIANNETVCIRHTSAASNSATTTTTLNVGNASASFSTTTKAAPPESSGGGGSMHWFYLLALGFIARVSARPMK